MSFNSNGVELKGQFNLKNTDPIDGRYIITSKVEYDALTSKDGSTPKYLYPGLTFAVTADLDSSIKKGLYRVGSDGKTITKLEAGNVNTPVYFSDGKPVVCTGLELDIVGDVDGNAKTATTLETARTIAIKDGVTGTATSFNGSANIEIPVTSIAANYIKTGTLPAERLPDSGVAAGTYGPSADVSGSNTNTIKVPQITVDASGRITAAADKTYTSVDTTYTASDGIKLDTGNIFKHTNSVTAGTASGSATGNLDFSGTFSIPSITYDAQGHITGKTTTTLTLPPNPDTHNSHAIISGKNANNTDIKGDASSGDITLGASGVTAGTYRCVTVNDKGIVIAGDSTDDNYNTAHTHEAGTGLELDNATGYGTGGTSGKVKYNVKYGTGAGTACQGNDSRLSDSRTPKSHTHGNINNAGTITSTVVTAATGVLVYDSNNKIQRATAASARGILSLDTDDEVTFKKVTADSFYANSDIRLKENFEPLTTKKSILDLPTYKFDFKEGLKNQIGCKAQDLREICPEIVTENEDGYLSIQESKIVYLLLQEVKNLKNELQELRDKYEL